jgi:hypothetical protein
VVTARFRSKGAFRLAWSLWLLSLLLLSVGVPLARLIEVDIRGLVEAAAYATVGAIVASRHSGNPIGWLFCALGVVVAFEFFGTEYITHTQVTSPGSLPGAGWMRWATDGSTELSISLFVLIGLLFPQGRTLSARWRPVVCIAAATGFAGVVLIALGAVSFSGRAPATQDPHSGPADVIRAAVDIHGAFLVVLIVASALCLILRQRRAVGDERQQLKWFTYSVVLVTTTAVISGIVTGGDARFALWLTPAVPVAVGLAILKYRLYEIDVIINRTLVYGVLTATLGLVYFSLVFLLQQALRPVTTESDLAVAGSTLVVAGLFRPARSGVQGLIDRHFYRAKYDAQKVLEGFAIRVRDEVELEALSEGLLSVVKMTMKPAHASLWLRVPDRFSTAPTQVGTQSRHG